MAGFASGSGGTSGGRFARSTLAEINVTPLVDVMLVLLVIFMVASSAETSRIAQQAEALRQAQAAEEDLRLGAFGRGHVPVDLPKAKGDPLKSTQADVPVLSLDDRLDFHLGDRALVRCEQVVPGLRDALEHAAGGAMTASGTRSIDRLFVRCLDALGEALGRDPNVKARGEILFRADRRIDYGLVLAAMARVRRSGVTRFGLVADTDADLGPPAQ